MDMRTTPSTSVHGVDHVQLPIPIGSAPQARAFYEGLLGLTEVRDPGLDKPGTLRFSLGGQRLDLSEGRYTGVAPQAHIAMRVQDLRSLTRSLHAAGLRIDAAPLANGAQRVYIEDPFGNRLELLEHEPHVPTRVADCRASDLHFAV